MTLETLGYIVHVLSFASFFYLASTVDVLPLSPAIQFFAWVLLCSGLILIMLSIIALSRNRGEGLIERGIYGVVRHPMYLGAIVLFLSWIFFFLHWSIVLLSAVNITIVYAFILQGERQNITKFGDVYKHYMESVPRINLFAGLVRRLQGR
jgi:protein-S-isoprenylcysteine O-methyltransferase Ste14